MQPARPWTPVGLSRRSLRGLVQRKSARSFLPPGLPPCCHSKLDKRPSFPPTEAERGAHRVVGSLHRRALQRPRGRLELLPLGAAAPFMKTGVEGTKKCRDAAWASARVPQGLASPAFLCVALWTQTRVPWAVWQAATRGSLAGTFRPHLFAEPRWGEVRKLGVCQSLSHNGPGALATRRQLSCRAVGFFFGSLFLLDDRLLRRVLWLHPGMKPPCSPSP